jgi:putative hemolysin
MTRPVLALLPLFALAACQSVGGLQPTALGKNRYQLVYAGEESAGLSAAQSFCVSRGRDYAAVTQHAGQRLIFACLSAGQGLGARVTCMDTQTGAKVCGRF